jgi:hypothetical protein
LHGEKNVIRTPGGASQPTDHSAIALGRVNRDL